MLETRLLTATSTNVSLLGFGLMRLPTLTDGSNRIDVYQATKMIDAALAGGVNYFDTAWLYHNGSSEAFAGAALSRHPRHTYNLATKLPIWQISSREDILRIFSEQLAACRVDYFDFYLIHSLNKEHWQNTLKTAAYDVLWNLKKEGRIRHLGFSFHDSPALLDTISSFYEWDFAQIQLNYLDWKDIDAQQQYALLTEKNIPVTVMEPVRGGSLASLSPEALGILKNANPAATPASWAIRFAASLPGVLTVLSGMTTFEHLEDNMASLTNFLPLSPNEYAVLESAAEAYRKSGALPCTGCRYCMDCPAGVDIPRTFAAYNLYKTQQEQPYSRAMFTSYYTALEPSTRAENCTGCGACLEHCPQKIDIPTAMSEICAFAEQVGAG